MRVRFRHIDQPMLLSNRSQCRLLAARSALAAASTGNFPRVPAYVILQATEERQPVKQAVSPHFDGCPNTAATVESVTRLRIALESKSISGWWW